MAHKIFCGCDNGTTGTIACVGEGDTRFIETPIIKEQSYTKAKKIISRIDHLSLKQWFLDIMGTTYTPSDLVVAIERPMINPLRFQASVSAARSLEATLCVIEDLGIPHFYVDSRAWQSKLLPKGVQGAPELKKASMDIGLRLFPEHEQVIKKHKDADGLLIAEWARRESL